MQQCIYGFNVIMWLCTNQLIDYNKILKFEYNNKCQTAAEVHDILISC